ncbi:MAG: PAS domain-containing protein [Archangiaceae bacterium]|nr:PAS domain-containing protein [Archangiaceae bacterium]
MEQMTRDELLLAVQEAQQDAESARSALTHERVLHDLQVHQIELEMQNRELREAQLALEESRTRYAELYDFAPVGYCTLEPSGKIRDANLTLCALLSIERQTLVGMPLGAYVVMDDRVALRLHLRRCSSEKERVTTELRLNLPRMGVVTFQMVSTPVLQRDGSVVGCKTALTDVSQLKRSELRLELLARSSLALSRSFEVQTTVREVVDSLVPAIADLAIVDVASDRAEWTRVAVAALPERRAVAEALKRVPPPRCELTEPVYLAEATAQALSPLLGERDDREAVLTAAGVTSQILVPLTVRGEIAGVLGLAMSDSRRRYGSADVDFAMDLATRIAVAVDSARLYRHSERVSRNRQDILSIVSHELKTPLAGVSLSTDVMLHAAPGHDRRDDRRHIERIRTGVSQMRKMIDDLLDFSSLESGHLSIDPRPTDVISIVDESIEMFTPFALEKELKLERGSSGAPEVMADRGRVLQVLANLLSNAIKFSVSGGAVTISVEAIEGERTVRVRVKDTGPGLPKPAMLHLFERYWQAQETASQGRGLGLYISKGIIEAHRGVIWVESQPGSGTSFYFTLPIAERARPASRGASS